MKKTDPVENVNAIKRKMEMEMKMLIRMQKQIKRKTKVAEPPQIP